MEPPVGLKDDERLSEELALYFSRPRFSCKEISPELLRVNEIPNKREQKQKLHILRKMLARSRASDIDDKMMRLIEFDKSESIIPHGKVSKRIYDTIRNLRKFDLYGKQQEKAISNQQEEATLKMTAKQFGTAVSEDIEALKPLNIFDGITSDLKVPSITTALHRIGHEVVYHPPVGFASNPTQPLRSYGHEKFFAYDGDWEKGKMSGLGTYQYLDGFTYKGAFKNNRPNGRGRAKHSTGSEYDGEWDRGKFGGQGTMRLRGGSVYTGHFKNGRREGTGKLEYPSGLVYEGEFHDGKPHGRGKVTSKLTGYSYEGEFKNGSIQGSGALETPAPKSERIVEFWRETEEVNKTLPSLTRYCFLRTHRGILRFGILIVGTFFVLLS